MTARNDNHMGKLLIIDEAHIHVPLLPELHWAKKHLMGNCKLPRGIRFNKFRGKDLNHQYEIISRFFCAAAKAETNKHQSLDGSVFLAKPLNFGMGLTWDLNH